MDTILDEGRGGGGGGGGEVGIGGCVFCCGACVEAIRYQALNEHLHCVSTLLSSRIFTADPPACDQAIESVPADPK